MKRLQVTTVVAVVACLLTSAAALAATKAAPPVDASPWSADTFAGLAFRHIGPAVSSGRVGDLAVDPSNPARYFVAVASGGVWLTTNNGATWTPVFDTQGSYSIGCVTLDPSNPAVVWVGSGENNSQRSVSFGDGVYRSLDGGTTWQNMGLGASEHVGMIAVDPRDSATVWVAAQGPLWKSGGDRGLYKTTDAGATWQRVLHISDDTGVNEVHLDPRDPDIVYATAYQRRRHVWTLINGGPEGGLHKSTDGGATWRKISKGLPTVDLGRIGLDLSPVDPDVVYAIVEAAQDESGIFRSSDRGESWERRSKHDAGSAQYYNELVADPVELDRVYSLETWLQVSEDGGATMTKVGAKYKHVDDHAMWIDPANNAHLLNGCDGGVYESWDRGATWIYKANLSVAQFYRVGLDNSEPFYFVYGGTQDNATLGGPSRTTKTTGITNEDWFVTVFGDGFQSRVDPNDPMVVYSEAQHGALGRFDRRSGEVVDIQPRERPGDEPYRWNWDAPLIISPHSPTRLYFAASRVFRSDDRGSTWQVISDDLSRGIDRNTLPVMGKVWGPDAVAKNDSTSFYGNAVALSESPLVEGLVYVGTDDGLLHVTADGGRSWRKVETFPGVPERTYISRLDASVNHPDTVFAAFSNHKNGDFTPYLLKSSDRGVTWTSIAGDLPDRRIVWSLAEDHVAPDLLFAGTELGLYVTRDGGGQWLQLSAGLPTVAVRDVAIQRRENDLVLATFGRGFYILDDYTPLRLADQATLEREAVLFPVKKALSYIPTSRLGLTQDKAFQGDAFYTAPNPPFGAVFTYRLKDKLLSRTEARREREKKAAEARQTLPYPSLEELDAEADAPEPRIVLTVRDPSGAVVRRLDGPRDAGFHRVAWDLRWPPTTPVDLEPAEPEPWSTAPTGVLALPGTYTVTLAKVVDGTVTDLAEPVSFAVEPLTLATFPAADRAAVHAFRQQVAELQRAVHGALGVAAEAETRIAHLERALRDTPRADDALIAELGRIERDLNASLVRLRGDQARTKRNEPTPPSVLARVEAIAYNQSFTTSAPTASERAGYGWASEAFAAELAILKTVVDSRLGALEATLEAAGAPWTPGRFPVWTPR